MATRHDFISGKLTTSIVRLACHYYSTAILDFIINKTAVN